jgi:hypothetical protein
VGKIAVGLARLAGANQRAHLAVAGSSVLIL